MIHALWRDGVVYAAGTVLSRGIALLLVPLVTRVLSPEEYGALDIIVTIGVLINLVLPLETSQALARFWNERAVGTPRRHLAGTAFTFTLSVYAVFAAGCALGAATVAQTLLSNAAYVGAVRAGGCAIALNGVFYLLQNQFRWELRPRAYAAVSIVYALVNLALVAALAWGFGMGLEGVLWAQAAAAACAAVLSLAWLRGTLMFGIARDELVAMLRFSLPLVPAGIAVFATFFVNRLMLNALATLEDVGIFGVASRLAGVVTLVLVGVQAALAPLVYVHHHEPETPPRLARLLEGSSGVALAACLALGLFGVELVALLTTPEYAQAAPLIGWLAVAAILSQMYIFVPGVAIAKKTHWQLAITVSSALVGVGLNALLIPRWGVLGATLATLAAGAVFFGAWAIASQRLYPLPIRSGPLLAAVGLFVLLGLVAPQLDAVTLSGELRALAKASVLLAYLAALAWLGLLRPREWRRSLAAAR